MSTDSFTVTTVWADGRVEERDATPSEIAQRQADIARFEADRIAREQAQAQAEATRESARNKLAALGLTEDEVRSLIP